MALDKPLCTYSDIIAETRNEQVATLPDIDHIVNMASRYVEKVTQRLFWYYDFTDQAYRASKSCIVGHIMTLPFPVIELSSVSINGEEVDIANILSEGGRRSIYSLTESYEPNDWSNNDEFFGRVDVKGIFGYELDEFSPLDSPPPTLPVAIRKAVALIASAWTGEYEVERVGFDGSRETVLETYVPEEAKRLLKAYMPLAIDF